MKKRILTLSIVSFLSAALFAQSNDSLKPVPTPLNKDENGKGFFDEINSLKAGKDTLFLWAKEWVYKTYKSGDAVIQMEDKDAGTIICKGRTNSAYVKQLGRKIEAGTFRYNFKLSFKDEKYRILISEITYERGELNYKSGADLAEDFPHNWPPVYYRKSSEKWWGEIKEATITELQAIILSLQKHMAKSLESQW